MIDFNRPAFTGKEFEYIRDAVERGMLCGDGIYTKKCSAWMEERFHVGHVMLTTSCTHALEMAAFLADIQPGDEVIMRLILLYQRQMHLCFAVQRSYLWISGRIP